MSYFFASCVTLGSERQPFCSVRYAELQKTMLLAHLIVIDH